MLFLMKASTLGVKTIDTPALRWRVVRPLSSDSDLAT